MNSAFFERPHLCIACIRYMLIRMSYFFKEHRHLFCLRIKGNETNNPKANLLQLRYLLIV